MRIKLLGHQEVKFDSLLLLNYKLSSSHFQLHIWKNSLFSQVSPTIFKGLRIKPYNSTIMIFFLSIIQFVFFIQGHFVVYEFFHQEWQWGVGMSSIITNLDILGLVSNISIFNFFQQHISYYSISLTHHYLSIKPPMLVSASALNDPVNVYF